MALDIADEVTHTVTSHQVPQLTISDDDQALGWIPFINKLQGPEFYGYYKPVFDGNTIVKFDKNHKDYKVYLRNCLLKKKITLSERLFARDPFLIRQRKLIRNNPRFSMKAQHEAIQILRQKI